MELRYSISRQDLLEAQTKHAGAFGRFISAFGALLIAVGVFAAVSGSAPVPSAIAPVLVGLLFFFRGRLTAAAAFKRDFANHPEVTATISESGIRFASAKGTSEIFWTGIVRFEETARLFILYTQSNAFHLIPKRAAPSETLPVLQSTLNAHLGKARLASRTQKDIRVYILLGVTAVMAVLLIMVIAKRA